MVPFADDLCSPSRHSSHSGGAYTFVAMRWDGGVDRLGKNQLSARRSRTGAVTFRRAHVAIHNCVHCLAPFRDSALGGILSLALFFIMGFRLLLLDKQLYHRGLRRCRSTSDVAHLRSGRKPHRCADVRIVGELSVRHRDAACCASGAAFPRTRGALSIAAGRSVRR
jgi:hypothetical protein